MTPDEKAITTLIDTIKTAGPHIEALFDHLVKTVDPATRALLIDLVRASHEMTGYIGGMALIEYVTMKKAA